MSKLKTASELAMERIIVSHYKMRHDEDDIDYIIEQNEKKSIDIVTEENATKLILNNDNIDTDKTEKKDIKNVIDGLRMQEPQTYHFEYDKMPEILINGNFTSYTSLGRSSRSIAFGLSNKNVMIKIQKIKSDIEINKSTLKEINILENNKINQDFIIYQTKINDIKNKNLEDSIIYLYLDNEEIRDIDKLNKCKEIWVYSKYAKNILEKYIDRNICIFPCGVDINRYNKETKKLNIDLKNFVFLSIFNWEDDSGYDNILKSYLTTFSNNNDVSLLILTKPGLSERIKKDFINIRKDINKSDEELPHIFVYDKTIPEINMPRFYASSNVFVKVANKQGNGLSYLEASSVGLPIIAGNWGNVTDFLTEDNSYLVEKDDDIEEKISNYMREVILSYEQAKEKNDKLIDIIKNKYMWDRIIDNIYERILIISGKNINKGNIL